MNEIIGVVLILLFAFLLVLTILGAIAGSRLLNVLRQDHPDVWMKLGSPTLLMNNSIRNNLLVNAFLRKREYLSLDNENLTHACKTVKLISRIYIPIFCVLVILFLLLIVDFPNSR